MVCGGRWVRGAWLNNFFLSFDSGSEITVSESARGWASALQVRVVSTGGKQTGADWARLWAGLHKPPTLRIGRAASETWSLKVPFSTTTAPNLSPNRTQRHDISTTLRCRLTNSHFRCPEGGLLNHGLYAQSLALPPLACPLHPPRLLARRPV